MCIVFIQFDTASSATACGNRLLARSSNRPDSVQNTARRIRKQTVSIKIMIKSFQACEKAAAVRASMLHDAVAAHELRTWF
jgi:hypothetical protein